MELTAGSIVEDHDIYLIVIPELLEKYNYLIELNL